MAWELKGMPKTVRVTTKIARDWSEMPAVQTDRPLSERRLQAYRRMVEIKGFRPVTWAKAYCKETDSTSRINGKHTSTLFATLDLEKYELLAVIEEYVCDTLEDLAKLYSTYDSRLQTRTAGDVNRSFSAVIPELADMPADFINNTVAGLAWWATPLAVNKTTAAERAERLFDEVGFVLWLAELFHVGDKSRGGDRMPTRHLSRAPVIGAIRACYEKSQRGAAEFWTAVRDETGPRPNTPDRKLARYLTQMSVAIGSASADKPARFKATQREFYAKCLTAWNAWRRGDTTDLKYYPDKKLPAAI